MSAEKVTPAGHAEDIRNASVSSETDLKVDSERVPEARGRDAQEISTSYWYSPKTLGSFLAIGTGFAAATGGFALVVSQATDRYVQCSTNLRLATFTGGRSLAKPCYPRRVALEKSRTPANPSALATGTATWHHQR